MKNEIQKKIAKLLDVKSIMTIALTIGFFILTAKGDIVPSEYTDIYKMIVIFYFGTQVGKNTTSVN